jgi:two-component system, NtrC family, response regulator AtoC
MPNNRKILVVDDEKGVRHLLKAMLEKNGYETLCVGDAEKALEILSCEFFGLVITDLRLPGLSGEELLDRIKQTQPNIPVVVISAYGNTKNIVDVIKKGADDYLSKPFTPEELEIMVMKALEKHRLLAENEILRQEISGVSGGHMVGRSKAIEKVTQLIHKFAPSDSPVLVTGESGVGKELAARAIHEQSPRSKGSFVQVNAGTIPSDLFEAELFGVKKGAFTGATESREGLFQAANGGTLVLDEIAEVPLASQAKLLRVLESGEVRALGDSRSHKVKVRVIAATNQNLEEMVGNKTFRKDLFYRLSVLLLPIPPLRERMEDVPLLANFFLNRFSVNVKSPKKLSVEALKWLMSQRWPGNVRELKNTLERAVLLVSGPEIKPQDLALPEGGLINAAGGDFHQTKRLQIQMFEREYLIKLLKEQEGNVSRASRQAGLARRNFQTLIKKHRINPDLFRKK